MKTYTCKLCVHRTTQFHHLKQFWDHIAEEHRAELYVEGGTVSPSARRVKRGVTYEQAALDGLRAMTMTRTERLVLEYFVERKRGSTITREDIARDINISGIAIGKALSYLERRAVIISYEYDGEVRYVLV